MELIARSGLPVRQWRQDYVSIAPPPPVETVQKNDVWDIELPHGMPKDAQLLPNHTQELLRAARSGRLYKRPAPVEEEEVDGDAAPEKPDDKKEDQSTKGFMIKVWKQVPRNAEGPTISHLAKKRKGVVTLSSNLPAVQTSGPTVTKATVRRIDAAGNPYTQEVTLAEGQHVEGEIISTTVVPAPQAVANAEGNAAPTPARRRPPPPKRKPKGPGRGRKKKVPLPATVQPQGPAISGQVPAENTQLRVANPDVSEQSAPEAYQANSVQGVKQESDNDATKNPDTEMGEGDDDEDGSDDGDDGEEGGDDEEDGENLDNDNGTPANETPSIQLKESSVGQDIKSPSVDPPAMTAQPIDPDAMDITMDQGTPELPPVLPPSHLSLSHLEGSPLKNVLVPSPTEPAPPVLPSDESWAPRSAAEAASQPSLQSTSDPLPVPMQPVEAKPTPEVAETRVQESTVQETHVQETPVQETSVHETPVQETPMQETPVQETPVQETAVPETAVQETAAQATPMQETCAQATLAQDTSIQEPAPQDTPVQETSVQETSIQETTLQGTPVQELPAHDAPAQETPQEISLRENPEQKVPIHETSMQEASMQSTALHGLPIADAEPSPDVAMENAPFTVQTEDSMKEATSDELPQPTQMVLEKTVEASRAPSNEVLPNQSPIDESAKAAEVQQTEIPRIPEIPETSPVVEQSPSSPPVEESVPSMTTEEPVPRTGIKEAEPNQVTEEPTPSQTVEEPTPSTAVEEPVPDQAIEGPTPGQAFEEPAPGQTMDTAGLNHTADVPMLDQTTDNPIPDRTARTPIAGRSSKEPAPEEPLLVSTLEPTSGASTEPSSGVEAPVVPDSQAENAQAGGPTTVPSAIEPVQKLGLPSALPPQVSGDNGGTPESPDLLGGLEAALDRHGDESREAPDGEMGPAPATEGEAVLPETAAAAAEGETVRPEAKEDGPTGVTSGDGGTPEAVDAAPAVAEQNPGDQPSDDKLGEQKPEESTSTK